MKGRGRRGSRGLGRRRRGGGVEGFKVVARRRGSCGVEGSFEWVLFKVPTIQIMSDHEEDLDDFPTFFSRKQSRPAESMVGAHRLESLRKYHHFLMGQFLCSSVKN